MTKKGNKRQLEKTENNGDVKGDLTKNKKFKPNPNNPIIVAKNANIAKHFNKEQDSTNKMKNKKNPNKNENQSNGAKPNENLPEISNEVTKESPKNKKLKRKFNNEQKNVQNDAGTINSIKKFKKEEGAKKQKQSTDSSNDKANSVQIGKEATAAKADTTDNVQNVQEKKRTRKRQLSRKTYGQHSGLNKLSVSEMKERIAEILNRETLSKTAKRKLVILRKKISLAEQGKDDTQNSENVLDKKKQSTKDKPKGQFVVEDKSDKDNKALLKKYKKLIKNKTNTENIKSEKTSKDKVKSEDEEDDEDEENSSDAEINEENENSSDAEINEENENSSDADINEENENSSDAEINEEDEDEDDDDEEAEEGDSDTEINDEDDSNDKLDDEEGSDSNENDDADDSTVKASQAKDKKKGGEFQDLKTQNKNKINEKNSPNKKRYVLFVGNLSKDTTAVDLKKHFLSKCSKIKDIRIPLEAETDAPRGFAYVEFENSGDYEKALTLHQTFIRGKQINVQYTGNNKQPFKKQEIIHKSKKLNAMRKSGKLGGGGKQFHKRKPQRYFDKKIKN